MAVHEGKKTLTSWQQAHPSNDYIDIYYMQWLCCNVIVNDFWTFPEAGHLHPAHCTFPPWWLIQLFPVAGAAADQKSAHVRNDASAGFHVQTQPQLGLKHQTQPRLSFNQDFQENSGEVMTCHDQSIWNWDWNLDANLDMLELNVSSQVLFRTSFQRHYIESFQL